MLINTIPTQILAKVDNERLQRGVESLVAGNCEIVITRYSADEIAAHVTNGDGKTYSVMLSDHRAWGFVANFG